jgi:hypothetical protein
LRAREQPGLNRPTPGNRSIQNERRSGYLDGGGNTITGNSRNQVYLYNNYDAGGIAVQSVDLGGGNTIGAYSVAGLPVQFFIGP